MKTSIKRLTHWVILLSFPLTITSCPKPIIPDPIDPRLPAYYFSGDNSAGAIVNDSAWVASEPCIFDRCNPIRFTHSREDSTLLIRIRGEVTERREYKELTLNFKIKNIIPAADYTYDYYVRILKEKKFELNEDHQATLNYDEYENSCKATSGQIFFKDIEKKEYGTAISGTFGFVIESDACEPTTVFKGRFTTLL